MAVNRYDKDEELVEKVSYSSFKSLLKYLKPHKAKFILLITIMLITALIDLLPPFIMRIVLDECVPSKNYQLLWTCAIIISSGAVLHYVFLTTRPKIAHKMSMEIISKVRSDLFCHMQHLPFSFFDKRPHGKIMVRVVNYVNSIAGLISDGLIEAIVACFRLFVILFFMFAIDVEFTIVCLSGVPVFMLALLTIKKIHRRAWQKYSQKHSNLNAYLQESISGMKITQSFAREDENEKIFSRLTLDTKSAWMKSISIGNITPYFVTMLSTITLLVLYWWGTGRIDDGAISVGTLIAFASYVSAFWGPFTTLTNIYNQIMNVSAYTERIFEMLDEPLVIEDKDGATDIGKINGEVEFKNVTFSYEEDSPNILENVSFKVNKGETIALVGPTGAGKSTVINLISRFYDINSGEILIDDKNIQNATLKSLRQNMGIMLQESFLFSGTIMDNIRYSKLDASDEEVIQASKTVCAHSFISNFPNGYNHVITEGATSLSSGQKQLIAFARVLLANPKILILDEATSSIDTKTEIDLQKGLDNLLKGRTSFIIAHRLSTIKNADKIMYVYNKHIAECGTHEELLALKGKYYELYQAQYKFIDEN